MFSRVSKNKKIGVILGILALANILSWLAVYDIARRADLEVNFFSVGQGDASFIQSKSGYQILIDGGPDSTVLSKLSREMPFFDRTIDLVVLSHPEKDHVEGLFDVLKNYKVENILWSGIKKETAESQEWDKLVKEEQAEGAKVTIAQAGEQFIFPSNREKMELDVLAPIDSLDGQTFSDANATSVVVKLSYGKESFLFTGDMDSQEEATILKSGEGAEAKSDVLKVGHHGSKTSSSPEFLADVSAAIGVIEVGKNNSYGLPDADVLARLAQFGIKTLRTDISGDIKLLSDGNNLKIQMTKSK